MAIGLTPCFSPARTGKRMMSFQAGLREIMSNCEKKKLCMICGTTQKFVRGGVWHVNHKTNCPAYALAPR